MKKIIVAVLLSLALPALAQDSRTQLAATVTGITGYPDIANSPAAVTTGAASARTAADVANFVTVRVYCTIETYFNMGGSTVTATTGNPRIAAGLPEVFSMGPNTRIAFITAGAAGSCDVTVLR